MSKIRHFINRVSGSAISGIHREDLGVFGDQHYATIDIYDIQNLDPENNQSFVCLWVGWYKNRGSTEAMWLMFETEPPRPPTEKECLIIVDYYNTKFKLEIE